MSLDSSFKRRLRARGNALKARVSVGKAGVTDAVLAQLRTLFENDDLLKVRILVDDSAEADTIAAQLAAGVPCDLVARTGFVALLYKPQVQPDS